MEIITTHVSSDFDSFSSMIAAKKLYPDAEIILPSSINLNVRKFITLHEENLPELKDFKDIDIKLVDKIIITDTRIAARLGECREIIETKNPQIVIFDHHKKSGEDINKGIIFTKNYGATTTIIVEIIKKKKIEVSPLEATLLLLGIFEDTGSFTFPNTSYMDFKAAAFLKKKGANLFVISKFLNLSLTDDQHILLENLISNLKKVNINEKEIIFSSAKTENYVEGLSVLTRKLSQIEDVDIVFCWVKMKDKIYVVARSDDAYIDISKIIEVIGGGGHPQAASAVLKNISFAEIENKIISSLYKNIKKPLLAKDIMSSPIRVVNEESSISGVSEILKKYGHSGVPIVDSNKNLVGIITRKDLDRAIKHGLAHAPVKGFKSKGIITTGPNTTVDEIQRLMIENGIGRIPVVQKNEVIGIVTRKDVLRYLHGEANFKTRGMEMNDLKSNFSDIEIKERLGNLIPSSVNRIFEIISETAKELKTKVYLVGGIVRDLLLGVRNLDIDIVVEKNGIEFAGKLSDKLNARIESYKKFNTAVIVLKNGQHIDVATARIEYYQKPAALPEVEPGSLYQDLARRDFTINTLAISLNKNNFGKVIDFFGGRKDLKNKKIKVLHKLSFIEDPTRIFRAVRFEQRLGFKMDRQTEKLAASSIEMDIMSRLNGIRIREEIIAILKEGQPWRAVKRLYELNALNKIGIEVVVDTGLINFLKNISKRYEELKYFIKSNFQLWRLYLIPLLVSKDEIYIKKWCSDFKIKNKDARVLIDSVLLFKNLKEKLAEQIQSNSELYKILKNINDELIVIISSISKMHYKNVYIYYSVVSKINLEINGSDLKALNFKPSKNYSIVLEELMELKLDGVIKNKREEIARAEELFGVLEQQ